MAKKTALQEAAAQLMASFEQEGNARKQKAQTLLKALSGDEPRKEDGKATG
jgi:hypothetical protein